MSTIAVKFNRLPNGPSNRGIVGFNFNDGNTNFFLDLELTGTISLTGTFSLVPYVDGVSGESESQAFEYAGSFDRDYKNIGGSGNLSVVPSGDTVTITAQNGTFNSASYTGDVLGVSFNINNTTQTQDAELSVVATGPGDCDTVQYAITATGDGSPWRVSNGLQPLNLNWDGSQIFVNIDRDAIQHQIQLREPAPSLALLDEIVLIVPRKLKIGEFKTRTTQNIGSSDVLIENVNPVAGTEPIEYAIEPQGTLVGTNYQLSNTFQGVLPGFYELFVKDQFGCEVTQTIQVISFEDASQEENPRYFDIPKGNSIILSECVGFDESTKPNFNNTLSHNELSGINYNITQYWNSSDFEPIHFKSSYPFHVATLHKSDGTKQDLPIVEVQTNRGSKEKVDCQLEPIDYRTKVYFDGGNEYEPDTTTVKGASPYTTFLPLWAEEGQLVTIDGMGTQEIVEIGYDSTLQRGFFIVEASSVAAVSGRIQVIWNIQIYNVFECYVPFSSVPYKARIVFEKGFSFNEIDGRPWLSEVQQVKKNDKEDLLIEWSSSKNMADIVFFSGVQFQKRVRGKFRPFFPNTSEISEGDSRAYSLDQELRQHYRLEIEKLSSREVFQLLIASKTDGFKVNGIGLIKASKAEIEELGESNYYTFRCEYAYGANSAAIQPDSLALNSSTGVVGGGGTGKPAAPPTHDGQNRLNIDGGFISIGGDFVSV